MRSALASAAAFVLEYLVLTVLVAQLHVGCVLSALLAGVAYFVPKAAYEQPEYHWEDVAKVSVRADIPFGTRIETTLVAESINGRLCYPFTWEGDPYGPESAQPVQAYAPKSWVSLTQP